MKRILFYSSVSDMSLFRTQKFYDIDIQLLENLGHKVILSNKISSFLKIWTYDIAFLYFYKWSFLPAIISRVSRKCVYFTGGIDDLAKNKRTSIYKKQRFFFKICYRMATKCFIVSNNDYDNIRYIIKKDRKNKLVMSLHTIEVEKFLEKARDYKDRKDFITIAWMNSIENVKRKGLDKAIYVFSKICNFPEYQNYKFYIAGTEGEGSTYLKTIIEEQNLQERVVFLGNIEESRKIELLNNIKYYFQLSEYEGFGLAAIEALAAGAVVIHSGRGGLQDGIGNNGIEINISQSLSEQVLEFQQKNNMFTYDNVKNGQNRLLEKFSNTRRQSDFNII